MWIKVKNTGKNKPYSPNSMSSYPTVAHKGHNVSINLNNVSHVEDGIDGDNDTVFILGSNDKLIASCDRLDYINALQHSTEFPTLDK